MTVGILCSGQGLQSTTMFAMTAGESAAAPIFDESAKILGRDARHLVAAADRSFLFENSTSQILCVTQALAAHACLKNLYPERLIVAGYSVGEMAAWSIAGAWTPREVLSLVAVRAESMDRVSCADDCLCAVRGLDRSRLQELCVKYDCEIAIVNPDRLFIVGGDRHSVHRLCDAAAIAGANRASLLDVNIASHTSRMATAIPAFQLALEAKPPRALERGITLISGMDGVPVLNPIADSPKLARQMGATLDWAACLEAMAEANVDRILELGPGRALAVMARSTLLFDEVRALDDFRSIGGIRSWISERAS
jgi:[acyl-carrier-protein] S-malonyltransferase